MPIPSFSASRNAPNFASLVYPRRAPAVDATAAAVTYTVTQVLGGLILRDPNGAARSDLLPPAAAIVAALQGAEAAPALAGVNPLAYGSSFEFEIRNTADAAETITVTTNTGLTLSGTMTIAQSNQKRFIAVVTNADKGSEAVTVYSAGTVVF